MLALVGADGADAAVFEVTEQIAEGRPRHAVDTWIESKRNDLAANTYHKWRGVLPFEPPRRPDPDRPAAPPMRRFRFATAKRTTTNITTSTGIRAGPNPKIGISGLESTSFLDPYPLETL